MNSASQIAPTLPGGGLARGALFTIDGFRLVSTSPTTVVISKNGSTIAVPLVSVDPKRIEAMMPRDAPLGPASLIVTVEKRASRPFPIEIVASNPGIFSRNLEGWGPGRIDNLAGGGPSTNSMRNPAHPGEPVRMAITGLGNARDASIFLGPRLLHATPTRGVRDGEELLSFTIPADAPKGCWVPVYLLAAPTRASNVVTISIAAPGTPCDPGPLPLWTKKNVMVAAFWRSREKQDIAKAPEVLSDDAKVVIKTNHDETELRRNDLLPPAGSCTAATSSYQLQSDLSVNLSSLAVPAGGGLDAGDEMTLSRGGETRSIGETATQAGEYRARLGFAGVNLYHELPPPFLIPGEFTLKAAGSAAIGGFSIKLLVPPPFRWTDRDQIPTVDRKLPLTVHWTGGEQDHVAIVVRNVDLITTAIGTCVCMAPQGSHQFTIPAALLGNIPATIRAPGMHYDKLTVGTLRATPLPDFHARGIDAAYVFVVYDNSRYVTFR